jgi:GNAT superfamily N-acetyltransferase
VVDFGLSSAPSLLESRRMTEFKLTFTVRPASPQDAAALTELRLALFRELGQIVPTQFQAEFETVSTSSFTTGLERAFCHAWLAETDARSVVGSIALLLFPRLPTPDSLALVEGYLLNVYTVSEWRKRGVSGALVAAAVAKGRELGLGRIRLHATAEGQPVYAAAGFRLRHDEMEIRL